MNDERTTRAIVRARSAGRCEVARSGVCGQRAGSMHHRLKRSHGGAWAPSNILDVCGDGTTGCHGWIEAHPTWAHEQGFWLMAGDESPELAPAHLRWEHLRSWFVLDDSGMLTWTTTTWEPVEDAAPVPASLRHLAGAYATMKP